MINLPIKQQQRLCYVFSDVDYSHLIDATESFTDKSKYDLCFVFLGPKEPLLYEMLEKRGSQVYFIAYRGKKDFFKTIGKLSQIFADFKPDIVHTHLFTASITGLLAARRQGIKKRVQTRHHSVECHLYYPHAVYYDKVLNWLSTKIVAISSNVADVLIKREGVNPDKVIVIRHGFDLKEFKADKTVIKELKSKYNLQENYPVIGLISRFVHWKGVQYAIPAFRELLTNYPHAKLVLANARGSYSREIRDLLEKNLSASEYILIEFEKQIFELYRCFDVFIHVPIDAEVEAFGQTYIEALALEVPSVFTLSGVANDFIKDGVNALVVPHCNSTAIYKAMKQILENKCLRNQIIKQGKEDVWALFQASRMTGELDRLYSKL